MADIFCSTNQEDFVQIDCGIDQAGIVAAAFIDPSVATPDRGNLEGKSWWLALLAVSPALCYVVTKTRGEYPGGTPTEEEGFGKESAQVTGATHEANLEFEGIDENRDFVEGVNRKKWKVALTTNGGKVIFIDNPVTVYGKLNVPKGITTSSFWMLNLKWQGYANPMVANAPDDIFAE